MARTAELISTALKELPAPPDGAVVINSKGERYSDENLDLFLYDGRVAMEWREAWKGTPLVLHDAGVVAEIHGMIIFPEYLRGRAQAQDVFSIFTRALKEHPGPVGCLRLDSSECPGPDLLLSWLDMLGSKKGGVGQLVLVNTTRPTGEFFPLDRLPGTSGGGGITSLALGFFALSPLDAGHLSSCLAELSLTACTFCAGELSALVNKLGGLKILVLGLCDVSGGHKPGGEGFRISSATLARLRMWGCTGCAITLEFAPSLVYFGTGVRPPADGERRRRLVDVDLGGFTSSLRELDGLALPSHLLSFRNPRYVWVRIRAGPPPAAGLPPPTKRRRLPSLPSLGTLRVSLHFSTPHQTASLVGLLRSLPRLTDLTISRLDPVRPEGDEKAAQDHPSTDTDSAPCISESLQHVVLYAFRGGAGEVGLASRLLATGRKLVSLTVISHFTLPASHATESLAALLTCPRASPKCQVLLKSNDDEHPAPT
ncbi:unnamed protein product [Urochloa humidicola]